MAARRVHIPLCEAKCRLLCFIGVLRARYFFLVIGWLRIKLGLPNRTTKLDKVVQNSPKKEIQPKHLSQYS